jgi:hypothetical protein
MYYIKRGGFKMKFFFALSLHARPWAIFLLSFGWRASSCCKKKIQSEYKIQFCFLNCLFDSISTIIYF